MLNYEMILTRSIKKESLENKKRKIIKELNDIPSLQKNLCNVDEIYYRR